MMKCLIFGVFWRGAGVGLGVGVGAQWAAILCQILLAEHAEHLVTNALRGDISTVNVLP